MRRIFLGLLLALVTFGAGALFVWKNTNNPVVYSVSSGGLTSSDHAPIRYQREIFPSSLEATNQFNMQLQEAADYIEFMPCFDTNRRRIGERAVMWLLPPHVPEATWRIMWTQQAEDLSEFFWVESTSLEDARHFETVERQEWRNCIAKNK